MESDRWCICEPEHLEEGAFTSGCPVHDVPTSQQPYGKPTYDYAAERADAAAHEHETVDGDHAREVESIRERGDW